MNNLTLKGNLVRDPDVRDVKVRDRETQVANFAIAVTRHFKKADGTRDKEVTFVDCEAWDTGAKTIGDIMHKGDPILLVGSLKQETWETDGQKRSKLKVRVSNFEKLYRAPPQQEAPQPQPEAPATEATAPAGNEGDDVPF